MNDNTLSGNGVPSNSGKTTNRVASAVRFNASGAGPGCWSGSAGGNCAQVGTVDPSDDFHTYQLIMDPVGNTNPTDDVLTIWVDGVKEQTWDRSQLNPIGNTLTHFGRGTAGSVASDQQWAFVRLETG